MGQLDQYREAIEEMLDSHQTAQDNLLQSILKEQGEDGLYLTMMTDKQKQPVQKQIQSLSIPFQLKALKHAGCGPKDIQDYASTLPAIKEALMLRTMQKGLGKKDRKAILKGYEGTEEGERICFVLGLLKQIKNSKKNHTISQNDSESSKVSRVHNSLVEKPTDTGQLVTSQDKTGTMNSEIIRKNSKAENDLGEGKRGESSNDSIVKSSEENNNEKNKKENNENNEEKKNEGNSKESRADSSDDNDSNDSSSDDNDSDDSSSDDNDSDDNDSDDSSSEEED